MAAAAEINVDKARVSSTMKTLVAFAAAIFAAGGGYTTLHGEIDELKNTTKVLVGKEERRSERDSEQALHLQRVDDTLEHMKDAIDRIDRNVQELRKH